MSRLKTTIIAIAAIIASIATAVAADSKSAGIQFAELTHDFGTVQEKNGPVSHTFKFTNTGNAPLVIISAKTSCGCTKPSFPKQPIQPGDSSEITVTYNPDGRPGEFDKSVTVRTNVKGRDRKVALRLLGTVIPRQ